MSRNRDLAKLPFETLGGTAGQLLSKATATDYDFEWIDNYTSDVEHDVKAGEAVSKGNAVYISSADGTNMIVTKADNTTEGTSSKTIGLMKQSLALNGQGRVITEGLLTGTGSAPLDTSTATAGDPVWLGGSGTLIFGLTNKPYAPKHLVFLGVVTRAHSINGEIFVKVQNGFELKEIHDVQAKTPSLKDTLYFDSADSQWKTASISTILGYTPVTSARTISTTAPLSGGGDLSANRTLSISQATTSTDGYLTSTDWNTFNSKEPALTKGNLTESTSSVLTITGGSNAIIGSGLTIQVKQATSLVSGYLSSTDWSTFNGKQAALSGSGIVKSTGGTISYLTDNSSNWDSAYTNRITSLTTTGSSGAATLISNVLNIPNYTLAGLGGQPLATNLTSLAGLSYASASFVKMTASGTFSLDTATYLTGNQTITLSGDVSGSGSTAITTTIGANKVTNSMLAQVSTAIFKGRTTAGTGNVEDLTATQATALLDTFTSSLKGLTPASGGGTTNFLRADGTWAAPSGGGGGTPGGSDTQIQYNAAGAFAGSANLVWDNTNTRLGIAQSTPTSRFHLNFNQNSVTQADANGILLANSTAATVGLQSISPPIVLQGNGWKTAATAGSQDVRFRMDVLPVQGTTSPTGQFRLALSVAGGAYTNLFTIDNSISASAGLLTTNFISTGGWITSGTVIGASSQIMGGSTNGASGGITYKLTNAGGSVTPKGSFGAINVVTAGTIGLQLDNTNHLIFTAGNGSAHIARAAIQILSLTNTAGSETGDLAFLTQTGGTAIAERMRIFAAGNVGIGTGSSNAGYKLDVNGTGRFSSALTTTGRIQAYSRKTSNYTLINTDKVIAGDAATAAITITLPAHVTGTEYTIVKADSSANKVTIATTSGTISGAATYDLTAQYMFITVISDGTNWLIISS